ncbi:MAG TPA: hypothetical protein VJS44_04335 [Pyrinomonadaceae bacterium]|nr:hypothetical protein [Pyrinomonadaceae bacterium]
MDRIDRIKEEAVLSLSCSSCPSLLIASAFTTGLHEKRKKVATIHGERCGYCARDKSPSMVIAADDLAQKKDTQGVNQNSAINSII